MRIFNINGISLTLENEQGKMLLKQFHGTNGAGFLHKLKNKQYKDSCCDIMAIVREGQRDSSTIFVDKDTKKPTTFKLNIKNVSPVYDEINITGSYNEGKPSEVSVTGTIRNVKKHLSDDAMNAVFKKLDRKKVFFSNMTRKLLEKTFKFYDGVI